MSKQRERNNHMEQFTTPTGTPSDSKKDRKKLYKWVGAGVGLLLVGAVLAGGEDEPSLSPAATTTIAPPTTTVAPSTTLDESSLEETIQVLAISQVLDQNRDEICRIVRELVINDGLELDVVVELSLEMFKEGFEDELIPESELLFRDSVRSCV